MACTPNALRERARPNVLNAGAAGNRRVETSPVSLASATVANRLPAVLSRAAIRVVLLRASATAARQALRRFESPERRGANRRAITRQGSSKQWHLVGREAKPCSETWYRKRGGLSSV
jgi:hypothetical protein